MEVQPTKKSCPMKTRLHNLKSIIQPDENTRKKWRDIFVIFKVDLANPVHCISGLIYGEGRDVAAFHKFKIAVVETDEVRLPFGRL
jgi:hypothetical protein